MLSRVKIKQDLTAGNIRCQRRSEKVSKHNFGHFRSSEKHAYATDQLAIYWLPISVLLVTSGLGGTVLKL